jgi:hypothetical protein
VAAQSFSSLKQTTAASYNKTLSELLNKNDVQGMIDFLRTNPSKANDASATEEKEGMSKKQKIITPVPLICDAIQQTLTQTCTADMCKAIIDAGCDLNVPLKGKTPVYMVLDFIATHKKQECETAEQLLSFILSRKDFDVNFRYQSLLPPFAYLIRQNHTFLGGFSADYISDNVLKMFIEKGAPVNTYDNEGNSLMSFALETENKWLQQYFFDNNIDLSKKNKAGKDALYVAVETGNMELLEQILGASGSDPDYNNAVYKAIEIHNTNAAKQILNKSGVDLNYNNALYQSIETGNTEVAQHILSKSGLNLNFDEALYKSITKGNTEVVKQILNKSALNLNLSTLRNAPESFRQYTEIYDLIAKICADKVSGFDNITLFRNKFGDKAGLVQEKLDVIDDQTFRDITHSEVENVKKNISVYEQYLRTFPSGRHIAEANNRLSIFRQKAMEAEVDDINKYISVLSDDIFYAKGDGLDVWDWIASGGKDMKNVNAFVIGRVTNTGKLPKKIKATITLFVITEIESTFMLVTRSTAYTDTYTYEWFLELAPGESDIIGSHFKVQLSSGSTGSGLLGSASAKYIPKTEPYRISFDYCETDIASYIFSSQDKFLNTLRENGNVAVKAGFESRYYEEKERERETAIQKCLQCEIDNSKFKAPTAEKDWLGLTKEKPGKIVMKNGNEYDYYWDGEESELVVKGYVWDDHYTTWKDMENAFLNACREKHCADKSIRNEADKRRK